MSTVEQRINFKFLAKLGKTPSECFTLLQQVTKKKQCQELVLLNGTNDSERVEKNVRTIKGLAGR